MAPLTPFSWVAESEGGTYKLNDGQPAHIGTWDCQTCVGVYFAFQDENCFCAHINPAIDISPTSWVREPQANEGPRLTNLVYSLLTDRCGPATKLKADREVVVVCPRLYQDKWSTDPARWVKLVGWYVVEGIREWLKDDTASTKELVCDEKAQGFVVHHRTGDVAKIPLNNSWDEVSEGVSAGSWFVKPAEHSLGGEKWQPSVQRGEERRVRSI